MKLIEDELFLRQKELKIVKDEIKLIGRNDVAYSEDRHDGNERNVQRKGEYGNCTCSVKDSQKVDIEVSETKNKSLMHFKCRMHPKIKNVKLL